MGSANADLSVFNVYDAARGRGLVTVFLLQ
jgi:hypothetical protein